jgi:hypothetical protein
MKMIRVEFEGRRKELTGRADESELPSFDFLATDDHLPLHLRILHVRRSHRIRISANQNQLSSPSTSSSSSFGRDSVIRTSFGFNPGGGERSLSRRQKGW